jgi:L-asparaginase
VLAGSDVRKRHPRRLDAFGGGDAGELGAIDAGQWRRVRDAPVGRSLGLSVLDQVFPRVEIVTSHAGARGEIVDAMVAAGVAGIVVAGTGNGTVHHALDAALRRAQAAGVAVRCSTRIGEGGVVDVPGSVLPASTAATVAHARIELMLELMNQSRPAGSAASQAG